MQVHVSKFSGVTSISAEVDNSILQCSRLFPNPSQNVKDIAPKFNVSPTVLNSIQREHPTDPSHQIYLILRSWMEGPSSPTLPDLKKRLHILDYHAPANRYIILHRTKIMYFYSLNSKCTIL